jgi:MFS family permease
MSLASMIPILGSAVGPIVGGYVTQYLNWRWTFWLMAILTACLTPLMAVVLRESYVPVIQRRRLKREGHSSPASSPSSPPKYWKGWTMASVKAILLLSVRPFVILGSSRVAVLMTLYLALLFGYVSILASTLATIFQDTYGFSESQSGLVYISLTVGTLTGVVLCTFSLDYFYVHGLFGKRREDGANPRSENRLIPAIPAMLAFPAGLFIYGWCLESHVHWAVPAIGALLCGFSLSSSTTPIMNYVVDIFGDRAASAVAAVLPLRYVAGAFLPIASPYMYGRLGYGWGNSLLAFVLLSIVPFIFLVIVQPRKKTGAPTNVNST